VADSAIAAWLWSRYDRIRANWEATSTVPIWPVCDRRVCRSQTSPTRLHLSLLRDLQRIVDLDPEVSDGALQFAMRIERVL